jgi:hypothetical protein
VYLPAGVSEATKNSGRLIKTANSTGQCKITDFFDILKFIDENDHIRKELNNACGNEMSSTVQQILRQLLENAERNNQYNTSKGNHDQMIKKFASSLLYLVGNAGYQLLQVNLGNALLSVTTVLCDLATKKKVKEGDFLFDELVTHLKEWKAPMYVHIHLDDTRIINRVEYDVATGRFVERYRGTLLSSKFPSSSMQGKIRRQRNLLFSTKFPGEI